jgi:ABC-type glycerol-3-phosphate transport system substrate-binding protein
LRARIGLPIAALLSGLLVLGAAGCTNSAPQPAESVELGVVDMARLGAPAMAAINAAFTAKHPNVKIVMKDSTAVQKGYMNSLPKNINTDPAPQLEGVDVVLDSSDGIHFMAAFRSLKEFPVTNTPPVDPKAAQVWDQLVTVNGKRYGLPFWVGAPLLSVHEGMLAGAGIQAPPLDWTYADFERVGLAARKANLSPNLFVQDWLVPMVRSQGGRLYDATSGSWAWDQPEVRQSLERMAGWVQAGIVDPGAGKELFYQGADQAVMTLREDGRMYATSKPGISYRPFPRGPHGRPVLATGLVGAVTTATTRPDLAVEYVRDLVMNAAVRLELARRGYRPVVEDPGLRSAWRAAVGDPFADAVELSLSDSYWENESYIISQEIANELQPYFAGQTSLENALATLRKATVR